MMSTQIVANIKSESVEYFEVLYNVLDEAVKFYWRAKDVTESSVYSDMFKELAECHDASMKSLLPYITFRSFDEIKGSYSLNEITKIYAHVLGELKFDHEGSFFDELERSDEIIFEVIERIEKIPMTPTSRSALDSVKKSVSSCREKIWMVQNIRQRLAV